MRGDPEQEQGPEQEETRQEDFKPGEVVSPIDEDTSPRPLAEAAAVAGRGSTTTVEVEEPPTPTIGRAVVALRHRDFRLFWSSQILSLIGTWMQTVAQSWLVLELTSSALALGIISALQFVPILLFSVFGGVIADRLPKRSILLVTQSGGLLLALVLGGLTAAGVVNLTQVMILAVLLGLVTAVDMPTRQAFVVELVRGQDLHNAIALNSAAFNGARLVGPAVAGLTIGAVGLDGCFFANALSFVFPVIALALVHAGRRRIERGVEASSIREDLAEGLHYAAGHPTVRLIILLVAVVGTFGMNMGILTPVLAQNVLRIGASGYGYLTSATGLGALFAALLLAYFGQTARPGHVLLGATLLGLSQIALALADRFWEDMVLLGLTGFSMIVVTTLANTTLQTNTPDVLRGRVMSLYTTVFAGTTPIGSLFAGALAQSYTVAVPFFFGGLISVVSAGVAALLLRRSTEPPSEDGSGLTC